MKQLRSAILFWALCFSAFSFLQAQSRPITTFIAPTAVVKPSTAFKADIKVVHFNHIVGAQFAIKWNPAILRFRNVSNFILDPNAQMERFGTLKTENGILIFQWLEDALRGRSLNDSTILFSINFDVIGTPNSFSPIQFTDEGATREVADTSYEEVEARYYDGNVQINNTTSAHAYNSAPHLVRVEDSYPNPFHDHTTIQLELQRATQVRLVIQDIQGKTVYEEQRWMTTGAHTLQLTKEMFPAAGAYQYSLIATEFIITQKLIFY